MNLYLRLLVAVIRGLLRPKAPVSHVAESRFRVMLHDIDVFGHMNNGRYLQIMDVARAEWMARAGVLGAMWRNRWSAMLGGTTVRFRRSLSPFQRYIVRTRLLCYDSEWFYLEHTVATSTNNTIAVGVSRAALRGGGVWLSTEKVMSQVEPNVVSAPMPDYVKTLFQAELHMLEASRQPCRNLGCRPGSGERAPSVATRG